VSNTLVPDEFELPDDWWQTAVAVERLLKHFRKHVVGLFIRGRSPSDYQSYLYTGFLIQFKDQQLWVSAGHVIDQVKAALTTPEFVVEETRWMDTYEDQHLPSAPAYLRETKPNMKSWSEEGTDFGAIVLSLMDRASLAANKEILVLSLANKSQRGSNLPEGYYVLGYPDEIKDHKKEIRADRKMHNKLVASLACLPIRRIEPPTDLERHEFWNDANGFYAKVLPFSDRPNARIPDIPGMSGGPTLSIEQDENKQFRYHLVGIQCRWMRSLETIRGVSVEKARELLDAWI